MTWYETDPGRLLVEDRSVRQSFPHLRFYRAGSVLFLAGVMRTRYGKSYEIRLVFPDNYPYESPRVFTTAQLRPNTPHRYRDGSLCIHYNEWSPGYTAAVAIGWAAHWFHAYDIWERTGEWLGREAAHG